MQFNLRIRPPLFAVCIVLLLTLLNGPEVKKEKEKLKI